MRGMKKSSTVKINCTSNFVGHLHFVLRAWNNSGSFCEKFSFDSRSTRTHKATATNVWNKTRRNKTTSETYWLRSRGQRTRYCAAWRRLLLSRRNAPRINHDSTRKCEHWVGDTLSLRHPPAKKDRRRAAVGEKTNRKWRVSRGESLGSSRFSTQSNHVPDSTTHTGFAFLSAIKHSLSFYHFSAFFFLSLSLSLSFFLFLKHSVVPSVCSRCSFERLIPRGFSLYSQPLSVILNWCLSDFACRRLVIFMHLSKNRRRKNASNAHIWLHNKFVLRNVFLKWYVKCNYFYTKSISQGIICSSESEYFWFYFYIL